MKAIKEIETISRIFEAKIVEDFYNKWLNVCAEEEGVEVLE